jgi:hypothetical protein
VPASLCRNGSIAKHAKRDERRHRLNHRHCGLPDTGPVVEHMLGNPVAPRRHLAASPPTSASSAASGHLPPLRATRPLLSKSAKAAPYRATEGHSGGCKYRWFRRSFLHVPDRALTLVLQVGGDPRRPKRVIADPGLDAGSCRPTLDHPVGVLLPHRVRRACLAACGAE